MPLSHQYAQTNLQLYSQLQQLGYPQETLEEIRRAYELTIYLFSGRYRANGKPFIAHLVGTASILAAHQASSNQVVAGMLHAAYLQGQFGDDQFGITADRTRLIRQNINNEAEELVAEYTRLPWDHRTLEELQADPNKLSLYNVKVILMRLANDLEDYLDQGMLYCQKTTKDQKGKTSDTPALVYIANYLGYQQLAHELADVFTEAEVTQVPQALCFKRKSSYNVPIHHQSFRSEVSRRINKYFRQIFT